MYDLCVGAVSRLVVEEAAKLGVAQIIASRRQVNRDGGYTGMTQEDLVKIVREHAPSGTTIVVRDHGGPYQNGDRDDDWVRELDEDVKAGFNGLHLDVSKLPRHEQISELQPLIAAYADVSVQIGGERDEQEWLFTLLAAALKTGVVPTHCIIAAGGHAHADQQCGNAISTRAAHTITECYHALAVKSVAHNCDWLPGRHQLEIDAINIAPEYGVVEMEAWLNNIPQREITALLDAGYESGAWNRWFSGHEGTRYERARCGMRYIWFSKLLPRLQQESWYSDAESAVRVLVSDHIAQG